MRHFKNIAFIILCFTALAQAQTENKSSNQNRSIEINNENGELSISFLNGEITQFIINDEPVSKDRYDQYQDIIDDFKKRIHTSYSSLSSKCGAYS